jgi:RNA polymerase sigma-70 factor, ECF subfamily
VTSGEEERVLRDAVLAGDERAWAVLFETNFAGLYAFARRRTGSESIAEDIVQECFLVAVRRMKDFDPTRGSFGSWLLGIASNLIRNEERTERNRDEKRLAAAGRLHPRTAAAAPPGGALDLLEEITLVMAGLPVHYRQVLLAKYEEGLSVEDIGRRSGESAKAVESLLSRAREAFRAAYRRLNRST